MNPNPEQLLQQFRLSPTTPELRARVLAAARKEWNTPSSVSDWAPLKRSLLAIAASLLLLAAGDWANHRLTAPASVASARPAAEAPWISMELAGIPAPLFVRYGRAPVNPRAALAALQSRQTQIHELLQDTPVPPSVPASDGQTRQHRQNLIPVASCC